MTHDIKKNTKTGLFLIISPIILLLVLIISHRGATPDTLAYWKIYNNIEYYDLLSPINFYQQTGVEIGFGWFSLIMQSIDANKKIFFASYSILIFYFILRTVQKSNINYIIFLIIYISSSFFFIQQFMQIRQGLACAMAMYALICLINNDKHASTYIILILSISIHQTAIILLMSFLSYKMYIFVSQRIKQKKILATTSILGAIFATKYVLMPLLISVSDRIESYTTIAEYSYSRGIFSLPNIRTALIFLMAFVLTNKSLRNNPTYQFFFFCLSMALIFRLGFSDFAILNGRFSTVVSFSEIFIIPMILQYRFSIFSRIMIITVLFFVQFYISLFIQSPILLDTYFIPLAESSI